MPHLKNSPSRARTAGVLVTGAVLFLAGCASNEKLPPAPRTIGDNSTVTAKGPAPHRKVGNPYKVAGIWYYPKEDSNYDETGIGSWYGPKFHGRKTANGELFDMNRLTAAHPTLPLPSTIKVTNLSNGRSIYVRLNDRGPFAHNRVVDLSRAAAERLGYREDGLAKVRVEYIGEASLADAITTLGAPEAYADGSYADVVRRPAVADMQMNTVKTRIVSGPEIKIASASDADELNTAMLADARKAAGESEARIVESPLIRAKPVTITSAATVVPANPYTPAEAISPAPVREALATDAALTQFMVQIGAYASVENAERVTDRLDDDMPVRTARIERTDGQSLYRVRLGPYRTETEAQTALGQARQAGFSDARVIRP